MEQEHAVTRVRSPKLKKSIIDCDIHNLLSLNDVLPYLSRACRERVDVFGLRVPAGNYLNGGNNGGIVGLRFPDGASPASKLDFLREHHLDPYHVEYGILTGNSYAVQASPDTDFAAALCSGYNDLTIEHWLADKRLKGSVMIPKQDPALAVKEIERVGGHPDMLQVIVGSGSPTPYGNRIHHPIYEACEQYGLPFTIHVGLEGVGINPPPTNVGYVSYYAEYRACRAQAMMAHLASFIYEGVFEKFPKFKVVLQEAGVFWIPAFLWRLDQDWKGLRHQTPWVKKKPSEYFRSNVKVTTQPIEETPNRLLFDQMMDSVFAKETLMFCSDFPHWDFDSPAQALPKMDDELWERVFYQNAADLYGLPARGAQQGVQSK